MTDRTFNNLLAVAAALLAFAQIAAAAPAAPMLYWDATPLTGKPRDGIPGTHRVAFMYEHALDGVYGAGLFDGRQWAEAIVPLIEQGRVEDLQQILPDPAHLREALKAVDYRCVLLLHTELYTSWHPDPAIDLARHVREFECNAAIVRMVRQIRPDLRVGVWSSTPHGWNDGRGHDPDGRFAPQFAEWRRILYPEVDFVADGYGGRPGAWDDWERWVRWKLPRTRLDKPVYAVLDLADRSEADAARMVRVVREAGADGVIVWGHPRRFDRKRDGAWTKLAEGVRHARAGGYDVAAWSHAVPWDARAAWRKQLGE